MDDKLFNEIIEGFIKEKQGTLSVGEEEKSKIQKSETANEVKINKPDLTFNEPRPEKRKSKGLKVFISILAIVIACSVTASLGYIAGTYSNGSTDGDSSVSDISLADKPKGNAENFEKLIAKVEKSVVDVLVYSMDDKEITGSASGVVYSKDGYIITNDHIYENVKNPKFLIRLSNGKEYKASFVAGDLKSDLAVLKTEKDIPNLQVPVFGNSEKVSLGESVFTVGYPSSYGDDATVTSGIVSGVKRRVKSNTTNFSSSFIQTDATINPGNSGGALFNMYGQVIGITSSKLAGTEYDAVSYAIPTKTVKRVISSLIKYKSVKDRAKLGITYSEINSLSAEFSKVPIGVLIQEIDKSSGLYGMGFSKGDIITKVNGKPITDDTVLLEVIEDSKANDYVKLTIYKPNSKKSKTVSVKLIGDAGSSSYNKISDDDEESIFDKFDDFSEKYGNNEKDKDDNDGNSSDDGSKTFDFPLN